MPQLYDMHCHLDFADDAERVARESAGDVRAVNATVVPSSYVSARERFAGFSFLHVALGIHPWWVANGKVGEVDVARFERLLGGERVVGEVGLDFAGRNKDSKAHQVEVFARVLEAIRACGDDMLNMMEDRSTLAGNECVFHWFSGTRDDFGRAVAAGCLFSVNMRMLATEAGRTFAAAVPADRLLMETDSPAHEGDPWSAGAWRPGAEDAVRGIAEARGMEHAQAAELLAANGERLFDRYCG